MKTEQEELLEKLTEATTELLIETGEELYLALREQNYELAAKLRDTNQQIIIEASKAFNKEQPLLSIEHYANHFKAQVEFIHNSLIIEYGEVI